MNIDQLKTRKRLARYFQLTAKIAIDCPILCLAKNFQRPEPPETQKMAEYGGYQEYGESSAQIWGGRALSLYLKDKPNLSRRELLGIISFSKINTKSKRLDDKEADLNEIYLSDPLLQKALNCTPSARQNCLTYFDPGKSLASSRQNSLKTIKRSTRLQSQSPASSTR